MPVMLHGSGYIIVVVRVVMVVAILKCYCHGCGCGCGKVDGMSSGDRDSEVVRVTVGCMAMWHM